MTPALSLSRALTPELSLRVRMAEPHDEPTVIALLERYVTAQGAAARYDWLYRQNPQGPGVTWLACGPGDEIVGFTSIVSRQFWTGGALARGGIGCDAYVLPAFRRRGIADQLHRASLLAMGRKSVPFGFMCGLPVPTNLRVLVRAGAREVGLFRNVGLPLTAQGALSMLHVNGGEGRAARAALTAADALLRAGRALLTRGGKGVRARRVQDVGVAFDLLWERSLFTFRTIGRRDAEVLSWRYLRNPVCEQQLVALEERDRLIGWAALELAPKGCIVLDYLLPLDRRGAAAALGALIRYVADQGASRLTLRMNPRGPYAKIFRRHGFVSGWTRDQFMVFAPAGQGAGEAELFDLAAWHFCSGDMNPEATPWQVLTTPLEQVPGPAPAPEPGLVVLEDETELPKRAAAAGGGEETGASL